MSHLQQGLCHQDSFEISPEDLKKDKDRDGGGADNRKGASERRRMMLVNKGGKIVELKHSLSFGFKRDVFSDANLTGMDETFSAGVEIL
uniref:Uncharacterized protein n=1 Tax=Timema poppense TaxID=170557 RepID=A0A7R9HHD5_TIMPO|nr:unnamed protein product [Timema poppensis]